MVVDQLLMGYSSQNEFLKSGRSTLSKKSRPCGGRRPPHGLDFFDGHCNWRGWRKDIGQSRFLRPQMQRPSEWHGTARCREWR